MNPSKDHWSFGIGNVSHVRILLVSASERSTPPGDQIDDKYD